MAAGEVGCTPLSLAFQSYTQSEIDSNCSVLRGDSGKWTADLGLHRVLQLPVFLFSTGKILEA